MKTETDKHTRGHKSPQELPRAFEFPEPTRRNHKPPSPPSLCSHPEGFRTCFIKPCSLAAVLAKAVNVSAKKEMYSVENFVSRLKVIFFQLILLIFFSRCVYLWLRWVFVAAHRLSVDGANRGLLSRCGARASHGGGFSRWGAPDSVRGLQ